MRLWGLGFDLPNLYHRDEAKYVSIPLTILKTGDFNPHFFNYPSLFFYALSFLYIFYFLFTASRGHVGSLDGIVLPEQVLENVVGRATMPSQFLAGRGFVAVTGVATVLLVYWLGRRAYSRRAGLIAALLLAFSPTHVRNSHFVAPDVSMVLLVMASFALCLEVWMQGRRKDYVAAGLLAGLAISTKYNAYAIIAPLVLAHALRRRGEPLLDPDILISVVACAAGFVMATPYALLDLPAFLNGIGFEMRHYATRGDPGTEGQNAILWYARYLARTEGLAPLLAAIEGARALLRRRVKTLLFLTFPAAYTLQVSFYKVKNDRTAMVIIPFLAVLAGALLDRMILLMTARVRERYGSRLAWAAAASVVLLVYAWPAWGAVRINARFADDDVRTQVTRWMEQELQGSARIVGEYYSPLWTTSHHEFRWVDRAIDLPLSWYQANADYVVLVENRFGGFYLDPSRYAAQIAAYEAVSSEFKVVREFQGGALGNPCHAIVYRVDP